MPNRVYMEMSAIRLAAGLREADDGGDREYRAIRRIMGDPKLFELYSPPLVDLAVERADSETSVKLSRVVRVTHKLYKVENIRVIADDLVSNSLVPAAETDAAWHIAVAAHFTMTYLVALDPKYTDGTCQLAGIERFLFERYHGHLRVVTPSMCLETEGIRAF